MYKKCIKRVFDILLSLIGIVVCAIPMGIVAIVIVVEDGSPAFFTQKRIGIHKKIFKLYKFRSMKKEAPNDVPTHLLRDQNKYLLKCGHIIRKFSIDELPQLFNIFKGDLSFVGPRPALWNQEDLIEERDKYGANDVIPGLTGWAQINGRDELEIAEKAKFDGEYVKRQSLGFDCKCFFGSFLKVLSGDGYSEGGPHARKEEDNKTR